VNAAGNKRQHQSPWLTTDASHVIFTQAKKRCYEMIAVPAAPPPGPEVIDLANDDDAWEALDDLENSGQPAAIKAQKKPRSRPRPKWLPKNAEPVLEEQPKWELLAQTLKEIEDEIVRQESLSICKHPFILFGYPPA